jgi:hypothetical protein
MIICREPLSPLIHSDYKFFVLLLDVAFSPKYYHYEKETIAEKECPEE